MVTAVATLIEDRNGFHGPRGWAWSIQGKVRKSEIMQGHTCYKMKEYNIVYSKYNSRPKPKKEKKTKVNKI